MAKKTATARVEPKAPATVAERRRALRDPSGAASGPGLHKVEPIDLTRADARKLLGALYPQPASETMLDADGDLEAAALEYITQRDLAKLADKKKEIAGNSLCQAIGVAKGVCGDGWKATWGMSKGSVDWTSLAESEGISEEDIERFRKAGSRTLDVREVADES